MRQINKHEHRLEDVINEPILPPEGMKALTQWCRHLDGLGRLDTRSQEVYIDEGSFRKMAREYFPREFEERFIQKMKSAPLGKLLISPADKERHGKLVPITWMDLAGSIEAFNPLVDVTFASLGLTATSTAEDVRKAVQSRFPEIPNELFDLELLRRVVDGNIKAVTLSESQASFDAAGVWSCCERKLGWWAMMAVFSILAGVIAAASIMAGPVGGISAAAAFALVAGSGLGGSTLVIVANCLINPYR